MIIKKELFETGKHLVEVESIKEYPLAKKPSIIINYKSIENQIYLSQKYSAKLNKLNAFTSLIIAIYKEITNEIDTYDIIGKKCIIEVEYFERDGEYFPKVGNVYEAKIQDEIDEEFEEEINEDEGTKGEEEVQNNLNFCEESQEDLNEPNTEEERSFELSDKHMFGRRFTRNSNFYRRKRAWK